MSASDRSQTRILIFGCGGHSRSVSDVILYNDPGTQLCYVDRNAREGEKLFGFDVKRSCEIEEYGWVVLAIGDNQLRAKCFSDIPKHKLIPVVSKLAHVSPTSSIGMGCFVGNYAHIGPMAHIGDGTIVNTGSVIEHEVKIGRHCHIGPNATISGRTVVGDEVFVGVGATVIDKVKICSDVTIGAGATVVKDICSPGTYVGTPARKLTKAHPSCA